MRGGGGGGGRRKVEWRWDWEVGCVVAVVADSAAGPACQLTWPGLRRSTRAAFACSPPLLRLTTRFRGRPTSRLASPCLAPPRRVSTLPHARPPATPSPIHPHPPVTRSHFPGFCGAHAPGPAAQAVRGAVAPGLQRVRPRHRLPARVCVCGRVHCAWGWGRVGVSGGGGGGRRAKWWVFPPCGGGWVCGIGRGFARSPAVASARRGRHVCVCVGGWV